MLLLSVGQDQAAALWDGKKKEERSPCVMCAEFFAAGHGFLLVEGSILVSPKHQAIKGLPREALTVGTTPKNTHPHQSCLTFHSQVFKLKSV